METSIRGNVKLLGVEAADHVTYEGTLRPDGTLYGEGQGICMGKNGEAASYIAQGVGTFKAGGAVSWRGSFYFQTQAAAWKRLNGVCLVFEAEVDAAGASKVQSFEWK